MTNCEWYKDAQEDLPSREIGPGNKPSTRPFKVCEMDDLPDGLPSPLYSDERRARECGGDFSACPLKAHKNLFPL